MRVFAILALLFVGCSSATHTYKGSTGFSVDYKDGWERTPNRTWRGVYQFEALSLQNQKLKSAISVEANLPIGKEAGLAAFMNKLDPDGEHNLQMVDSELIKGAVEATFDDSQFIIKLIAVDSENYTYIITCLTVLEEDSEHALDPELLDVVRNIKFNK